ncbi:MAG: hypothetical protein KKB79_03595 [Nanoarchaeota archaeon]|nr:hypothetical protein [Nanoarchaeota archaeon]
MKKILTSTLILLIIISLNFLSAFDVISQYNKENPLELAPGEVKEIQLILKNTGEDKNITLTATVLGTGASILGDAIYPISPGTEIPISLEVSAPENASVGKEYEIDISFNEVKTKEGGILSITSLVTTKLPVKIVDKTRAEDTPIGLTSLLILGVIGIAIIIKIFLTGKEDKVKKKKSI